MDYGEFLLSFLDCFSGLTWIDRFGARRIIWDNEFFFEFLYNLEKKLEQKGEGLFRNARYKYCVLEYNIDQPPVIERKTQIDGQHLTLFTSGHIYVVHTENYDLNSENFLFKTLEDLPENVRNGITEWHKLLRENLPEALTESVITFLCSSLALCLNTELLGYVYLTPDERGYIYSIPVCTDDDKKFMMKVFSKMNILIGKKTIDKWQSQSEKEFRHKVAKPFLRNRYFEYRENDLGSDESLKKAIEDIKEAFPQWQDIWNTLSEESIMRHYIRKKN